jgi:hypothetical protein
MSFAGNASFVDCSVNRRVGLSVIQRPGDGNSNSFASKPTSCFYYVTSALGPDSGSGSRTDAAAFQMLTYAHLQLLNYVSPSQHPNHGNFAVCIESGTYYAPDYTLNMSPNPVMTQTTAVNKATLGISVAGTATGQIWFMGAPGENPPVLIQSGYNGIQVESTAQYITLYGVTVQGTGCSGGRTYRNSGGRTTSSPGWPFLRWKLHWRNGRLPRRNEPGPCDRLPLHTAAHHHPLQQGDELRGRRYRVQAGRIYHDWFGETEARGVP